MARVSDPMERLIADALDSVGEPYQVNVLALDFYLPDRDVFIEVKRMHSDRIADQMSRADNVIAAQGVAAVSLLADMLRGLRPVSDTAFEAIDDALVKESLLRSKDRASQFARDMAARYPRVMARLRASELAEKTESDDRP